MPPRVVRRCSVTIGTRRCRNPVAFRGVCQRHANELMLDDGDDGADDVFGALERVLGGGMGQDELAAMVRNAVGGLLGNLLRQPLPPPPPAAPRVGGQRRPRPDRPAAEDRPPPPPPPPPPSSEERLARARETLGFAADEKLTRDLVQARKRALARVFHPDAGAGNRVAVQRVLEAADALLATL